VSRSFRNLGHDFPPLLVKLKSIPLSKGEGRGEGVVLVVVLEEPVRVEPAFEEILLDEPSSVARAVREGVVVGAGALSSSSFFCRLRKSISPSANTKGDPPSTATGIALSMIKASVGAATPSAGVTRGVVAVDREKIAARPRKNNHCNFKRGLEGGKRDDEHRLCVCRESGIKGAISSGWI